MEGNALFTVGQKAFIIHDKKLLILTSEKYGIDFPGGRIKEGELDFQEALKREVIEETGLEIEVGKPYDTWFFETKEGEKIFCIGYLCTSRDSVIRISDEHDSYVWVDKNNFEDICTRSGKYDVDVEIVKKLFLDPELF